MKTIYLIPFFILQTFTILAQDSALLINENFTGLSNGNLGVQNSWNQEGSNTDIQIKNSLPLSKANYTGGGSYISLGAHNGKKPYKNFNSSVELSANPPLSGNTVLYFSFLIRVIQPYSNGSNIDWVLSLRTNEQKTLGHFFVKYSSATPTKVNFGINTKPEIDSTKATWTKTEYSLNTTFLIVLRYDMVRNADNDIMYLWIDPNLSSEVSTTTANATLINGQEDYSSSSKITAFQLHQKDYCSNVEMDAFKVAYGANGSSTPVNSAAAWHALNPMSTLLPVKFISFTVLRENNDAHIEWKTAEELNSTHFEIERSENGTVWKSIAIVNAAGNSNTTKTYSYTDKNISTKVTYYRVKQVDEDGQFIFTVVRSVIMNGNTPEIKITAASNNSIYIHFSEEQKTNVMISITSFSGQLISKYSINHPVGQVLVRTQITGRGAYIVTITDGNGLSISKKILL